MRVPKLELGNEGNEREHGGRTLAQCTAEGRRHVPVGGQVFCAHRRGGFAVAESGVSL